MRWLRRLWRKLFCRKQKPLYQSKLVIGTLPADREYVEPIFFKRDRSK